VSPPAVVDAAPALEVGADAARPGPEAAPQPATTEAPPTPPPGPLAGRRVCIDPGHDARWVAGATGRNRAGQVPLHPADSVPLYEHELTLSVAYRLKGLLESEGAAVCVTRRSREEGGGLQREPYDFTGDARVRTAGAAVEDGPERIQPRIDQANDFGAEVLVSVHFNGLDDGRVRGSEVYFSDTGPSRDEGRRLAGDLLAGLLAEMSAAGYRGQSRGVLSDRYQRYSSEEMRRLLANNAATILANGKDPANCPDCHRLLTLGNNPMSFQPGRYVGAMVEVEFLSNPEVVEDFILRPDSLDVIARGLLRGLQAYFAQR
jgi:N-acetylmuramoyl-L-alanine amidase